MLDPKSVSAAIQGLQRFKNANKYKRLVEFVRAAWPIIEGGNQYKHNWHIDAICEHLEAVTRGEISNLLINIPPGCMKSLIVSVCWPAWEWKANPELRYLGAAYAEQLSIRDAMKTKLLVESTWYQSLWPHVRMLEGANTKLKYETTKHGWRMSTSVGGRGTGEHPDRKIIDDPHNAKEAESEAERQQALDWFDLTLTSRGASRDAKTVVVMQRLNEKDLSGHIMAKTEFRDDWVHLMLPMRFEENRRCSTRLGFVDPRKKEGELLWPSLFDEKKVAKLEAGLAEYGTAGQLMQRPAPIGGGMIKTSYFKLFPRDEPLPDILFLLQSYDTAYTEKYVNDPTACLVWGVFERGNKRGALLLDAWTEHMNYPQLRVRLIDDWQAKYGGRTTKGLPQMLHPPRGVDLVLIEEKGSGIGLIQDLRRANVAAIPYNPGRADKTARAIQASPTLETGCLWVLESSQEPGKPITWARKFIHQMEQFPAGEHDDYVDAWSQAMLYLRDKGLLVLPEAPEQVQHEVDYNAQKHSNPYAV